MRVKTYKVGDVNSSPIEPTMTDIVIYRHLKRGHSAPEVFPAIVVRAYENDVCDLTVFSNTGVRYINNVKYSGDDEKENTWGWNADTLEGRRREPEQSKPLTVGRATAKTA